MKVGRGSIRPMSKVHRKCTSSGRSPLLYTAILIVLGMSLVLAGCGQLSLTQLLENEEPGELRVSPASANVPVDTVVTIQGKGGFKPYTYTQLSGGGSLDAKTGVFSATGTGSVTIEVTDSFGKKAQGTLEIVEQLQLLYLGASVSQLTVALADLPLNFGASDGVFPYVFYVDGAGGTIDSVTGVFNAGGPGEYLVEVLDSVDNSAVALITVVNPSGPLTISPEIAYVQQGNTVVFTAYNETAPFDFTVDAPASGSIAGVVGAAATYQAPAFETVDTVRLTDALTSVTATVHVVTSDPEPLSISPSSVDKVKHGDEITFTASGGIPPYTFWAEHDDVVVDRLDIISADKARYTAPNFNTTDWVWLEDALGNTKRVKVKVK